MKKLWVILLSTLILVSVLVWLSVFIYSKNTLKITACNVGQGDAFLITLKDFQILVDGGPNSEVLSCLSDNMPFWDRRIEVVILSHSQKDHFMGLIEVFKRYDVKYFLTTPLDSSSPEWSVLKDLVGGSATRVINPEEGNKYRFGLIYLDILSPSEEYLLDNLEGFQKIGKDNLLGACSSKKDPNDFSIVASLSFGDFDTLFTGDIGPEITKQMIAWRIIKDIEYLKVPHHGSKNGLNEELLNVTKPEVAVISAGKGNLYGHPHKEVLEMLESNNVRVFRTDISGDITVESNGEIFWLKI